MLRNVRPALAAGSSRENYFNSDNRLRRAGAGSRGACPAAGYRIACSAASLARLNGVEVATHGQPGTQQAQNGPESQ